MTIKYFLWNLTLGFLYNRRMEYRFSVRSSEDFGLAWVLRWPKSIIDYLSSVQKGRGGGPPINWYQYLPMQYVPASYSRRYTFAVGLQLFGRIVMAHKRHNLSRGMFIPRQFMTFHSQRHFGPSVYLSAVPLALISFVGVYRKIFKVSLALDVSSPLRY